MDCEKCSLKNCTLVAPVCAASVDAAIMPVDCCSLVSNKESSEATLVSCYRSSAVNMVNCNKYSIDSMVKYN